MASNLRVDSIVPSTSGNVSIGTATGGVTIPGDLGVAGVVTYEDVTNVDSVGIVTARSGIRVTSTTAGIAVGTNAMVSGRADNVLHLHKASGGTADGPTIYFTNQQTGVTASDGLTIGLNDTQSPYIWNRENTATRFGTNNAERLRIGPAGQIGLGGANYGSSGQVLTSQGSSSAPTWATASSGLSHAQQWYLTANGNTPNGGTDYVLPTDAGTWQKHSAAVGVSAGTLGSDMTYSGSGIFTFPVTGIWKIEFQGWWGISSSDSDHYLRSRIQTTVNNSSYSTVQEQANSVKSDATYTYQGFNVSYLFDVTSTSNCKVRFVLNPSGSNTYYKADGSPPKTGALFMRLGDT